MNFVTIEGKQYIKSQNIRVFPCAYRGYYNSSATPVTTLVFDPEARATTEANFTNTFHKLSDTKESYVVAWVPGSSADGPGTLKCVIGGYYFEIYNHQMSDFFNPDSGDPYYLCVKTESIPLGTSEPDETNARTTKILSSFAESTNYLDIKQGNDYVFTGLLVSTVDTGTASLAPFVAVSKGDEGGYNYKINPTKLPITNLLDVGSGNYSIRMIEDVTEQGTNTTVANGNYSIALGRSTTATGEASLALGNNTEASAKGAFTAGNNTIASGEGATALGNNTEASGKGAVALGSDTAASAINAVALGSNTKAMADNQVVIGQYNVDDAEQAFIIANGTTTTNSNKFTVSYDGDVKALGNLEVNGNNESSPAISSTGATANDFVLGKTAQGSYGSIKVYGEVENKEIFTVTKDGNTKIAGNTEIAGATTITTTTSSTSKTNGALIVYGGVGIGSSLNVGGTTNINGNTQITNTTAASGNTAAFTVKGGEIIEKNLIIKGTDNSSSVSTGALVVKGGVGIDKNLYIGGTTTVTGETTLNDTLRVATDKSTQLGGTLTVTKAATLQSTLEVTGTTTFKNTTAITNETDYTTGSDFDKTAAALKVKGGTHIAKKLNVGGATSLKDNLTVADSKTTVLGGDTTIKGNTQITITTDYSKAASGTPSAALVVNGGAYIAKKLHVDGDTTFYNNLEIGSNLVAIKAVTQSTAVNNGALTVTGGVGIGKNLNVNGDTKIVANLTLAGTAGTANRLQVGNESTSNKGGELLIYGTGTTKVFHVDNTGNTDLKGNLTVAGTISSGNKLSIGSGTTAVEISSAGITGLSGLTVSGQINATMFNATSDARLKCNIEDYVFEKSILDLPIKRFEFIKDETHTKYIGCLAQDLQEICPEFVNENSDGTLSIQESKLVYALLQEVKELKEKVDQLERR